MICTYKCADDHYQISLNKAFGHNVHPVSTLLRQMEEMVGKSPMSNCYFKLCMPKFKFIAAMAVKLGIVRNYPFLRSYHPMEHGVREGYYYPMHPSFLDNHTLSAHSPTIQRIWTFAVIALCVCVRSKTAKYVREHG